MQSTPPRIAVLVGLSLVVWAPVRADDDATADWDRAWRSALADSARDYATLSTAFAGRLAATSAYTRRKVLRYLPDDEETRRFLGYARPRAAGGADGWVRVEPRRGEIADLVDSVDPKAVGFPKKLREIEQKVVGRFAGLARRAQKSASSANAADWTARAVRGWERVLEIDDGNEEAHAALGHPRFEGKYVTPFKLRFLHARAERRSSGEKLAARAIDVRRVEIDGTMAAAGLVGGGAKAAHVTVYSTHGYDVAARFARDCELGLADLVENHGFPESIREHYPVRVFCSLKNAAEGRVLLSKGAGLKAEAIERFVDKVGGLRYAIDEYMTMGGPDDDDGMMAVAVQQATLAEQGFARFDPNHEDWLWQSIGYDVTKRILRSADTSWGAFGRYGQGIEFRAGIDHWIELARRLVETDDDVPLSRLLRLNLSTRQFNGPETVKGWALLSFLYEKDVAAASRFVLQALAGGTPSACAAVYPDNAASPDPVKSVERLDAEYREWILKSW